MHILTPEGVAALTEAAEWLEAGGDDGTVRFDMRRWGVISGDDRLTLSCTSRCCIGGFIHWRTGTDPHGTDGEHRFGLALDQTEALFFPEYDEAHYAEIADDTVWAARTVRHFLATGEVDWMHAQQS